MLLDAYQLGTRARWPWTLISPGRLSTSGSAGWVLDANSLDANKKIRVISLELTGQQYVSRGSRAALGAVEPHPSQAARRAQASSVCFVFFILLLYLFCLLHRHLAPEVLEERLEGSATRCANC